MVLNPQAGVWAVADGAGGHAAGHVASSMIASTLASVPPDLAADKLLGEVRSRLMAVHTALRQHTAARSAIASTVVALMLRQGHFACLWAGDSRAYLLRDSKLMQITRDHSLVQELVDVGSLTPEEARRDRRANIITRALGADLDTIALDKSIGACRLADRFLLCSDGLFGMLDPEMLASLLLQPSPADALVQTALHCGTRDNVTAIVLEIAESS